MGIKELREKGRNLRVDKAPAPDNVVTLVPRPPPDKKGVFPHPNGKFSPEVTDVILTAVRIGNYFTTAASLAGIHVNTLYRWLSEGEEDEGSQYRDFYLDMLSAEAEAEVSMVTVVRSAAESDYRAGLELLSRRFPEHWSSKHHTELSGANGAPIELVVSYEDEAESGD